MIFDAGYHIHQNYMHRIKLNFVLFSAGMCVLAGCDFLPSVPGIGIAKAYALVSKYRNLERVRIFACIQKL